MGTDQVVVQPGGKPLSATSGVVGLRGNFVPNGATKVAGMADLQFAGSARFDGEEARFDQVKNKNYREGEVLVIRYGGLQAAPGCEKYCRRRLPSMGRKRSRRCVMRTSEILVSMGLLALAFGLSPAVSFDGRPEGSTTVVPCPMRQGR
jgi:dihydroxyacid dehydratase/phosphogluconate dehydratase